MMNALARRTSGGEIKMADIEDSKAKWARITAEMKGDMLQEQRGSGRSGPNWLMFTPILWAPVFPVIRLSLRSRPVARVRAFVGAIVLANVHAFWIINDPEGELFKPVR
jgi:hypothetical protein